MGNYIILPRFEFTALYKYGEINIVSENMVPYDLPESVLIKRLAEVFKKLPYFEYDDEYIILGTTVEKSESSTTKLRIDQVDEVVALSNQAKISLESKVDKRIDVIVAEWSNIVLKNIEEYFQAEIMVKGIDALWRICGFDGDWRKEDFLPQDILGDLVFGLKERANFRSKDKQQKNLLVQAIVYDRTDFFPDGYDGYLFDLFEILCNHLQKGYTFSQTTVFPWLMDQNKKGNSYCWTLYKNDTTNENLKNIKSALIKKFPEVNIRWENSLAWYFAQKADIQKRGFFDLNQFRTELDKKFNDFVAERKMAVILLGAFFGYKYFYDALYDKILLKFFKKPAQKPIYDLLGNSTAKHLEEADNKNSSGHVKQNNNKGSLPNDHLPKYPSKRGVTKNKTSEKQGSKSKAEIAPEFSFTQENSKDSQEGQNHADDIPLEVIRNDQDEPQLLNIHDTEKISKIVLEIVGTKMNDLVFDWVNKCIGDLKQSGDQSENVFVELLMSSSKPKGFTKIAAKKIAREIFKNNLL